MTFARAALVCLGSALFACAGEVGEQPAQPASSGAGPEREGQESAGGAPGASGGGKQSELATELPPARLRRLTLAQYANTVRDLLGSESDTSALTPIPPLQGMQAIGASTMAIPERDVELFAGIAERTSAKVFADAAMREKVAGCDAKQPPCAENFLLDLMRRAFRRPVADEERARYLDLLRKASAASGDAWRGLELAVSALLQSPFLLYREELGQPESGSMAPRKLNDFELASRLSYFLWNSTPDQALLEAAAGGKLASAEGLAQQARRLLASPRAAAASEQLFTDYLQLDGLDALTKLPETYPRASPTLPSAMKQETLLSLRTLVFERGGDFREAFRSTSTFVDAELAKLYGLSPTGASFSEVALPASGPRAGLLTQASFLALHAHPSRSSPTLRGKFIRESLLCRSIPPPPNDVVTELPETGRALTARQKLTAHRENPTCAGCHALMDPMGLALENFDGIGAYRKSENGQLIDTSGELDGASFRDARELGDALAAHPDVASCFVKTLVRYARGALEHKSEEAQLAGLTTRFAAARYRVQDLMLAIASDPSFRYAGPLP